MSYPYHPPLTIQTPTALPPPPPHEESPLDFPPPPSPPLSSPSVSSPTTQSLSPPRHTRLAADVALVDSTVETYDHAPGDDSHPHASHDDELPSYSALVPLPTYDQSALAHPFALFTLRGFTRKTQLLIPAAACVADGRPCYKLSFRTTPRVFSRKPDIVLTAANSLISPMTGAVALAAGGEEELGKAFFESSGGSGAWFPRARVQGEKFASGASGNSRFGESEKNFDLAMESRNFVDWTFSATDVGIAESPEPEHPSTHFAWRLTARPTALVLVSVPDGDIVARFTHSAIGTFAKNGGEVGELAIYSSRSGIGEGDNPASPIVPESRNPDCPGFVPLVLTLATTMFNLRRMGRHHWNDDEGGRRRSSVGMPRIGRGLNGPSGRLMSNASMPEWIAGTST